MFLNPKFPVLLFQKSINPKNEYINLFLFYVTCTLGIGVRKFIRSSRLSGLVRKSIAFTGRVCVQYMVQCNFFLSFDTLNDLSIEFNFLSGYQIYKFKFSTFDLISLMITRNYIFQISDISCDLQIVCNLFIY